MKSNNSESFPHLDFECPIPTDILDTPISLIDDEHLWTLSNHLSNIQEKFSVDEEVVLAAAELKTRIEGIVNLGETRKSGEIMQAANDSNYLDTLEKIA